MSLPGRSRSDADCIGYQPEIDPLQAVIGPGAVARKLLVKDWSAPWKQPFTHKQRLTEGFGYANGPYRKMSPMHWTRRPLKLVPMPVVDVRKMSVSMVNRQVHMRMRMRLFTRVRKLVLVLVMPVMAMPVRVFEELTDCVHARAARAHAARCPAPSARRQSRKKNRATRAT